MRLHFSKIRKQDSSRPRDMLPWKPLANTFQMVQLSRNFKTMSLWLQSQLKTRPVHPRPHTRSSF